MSQENPPAKGRKARFSLADLVEIITEGVTLWRTTSGVAHVDFVVNGVAQSAPIKSKRFRNFVRFLASKSQFLVNDHDLAGVLGYLEGIAEYSQNVYDPAMRVIEAGESLFYDTGRDDMTVVEFGGGGWRYIKGAPVRFARGQGSLAQVDAVPSKVALRDHLKEFVRASPRDLALMEAWLIGAMKPSGPYPILIMNGEQGSAKSTTTRVLARIIDPHAREIREPPSGARDLVAAVHNSFVLAFDNVSRIPPWFSDSLCRLATGTGAIGGRALYTDADEFAFMATRPIILNGIPDFVEREDLADRTLNVSLPAIPPEARRDDDSFWKEFSARLPEILGSLYAAVARAHAEFPNVVLDEAPRMANFARWVRAGLGKEADVFLQALSEDRKEAAEALIEHSQLAQAVIEFFDKDGDAFVGTLPDLMRKLSMYASGDKDFWPRTPLQMINAFKRISPVLRKVGIIWEKCGREGGTGRSIVRLYKTKDFFTRGYAVSVAPEAESG